MADTLALLFDQPEIARERARTMRVPCALQDTLCKGLSTWVQHCCFQTHATPWSSIVHTDNCLGGLPQMVARQSMIVRRNHRENLPVPFGRYLIQVDA